MNVQASTISAAISQLKTKSTELAKPVAADLKSEAPEEESRESASTEASEHGKGGTINTYA